MAKSFGVKRFCPVYPSPYDQEPGANALAFSPLGALFPQNPELAKLQSQAASRKAKLYRRTREIVPVSVQRLLNKPSFKLRRRHLEFNNASFSWPGI